MRKETKNPVAKFAFQFNKAKVEINRKKQNKKGYIKHKSPDFGRGCLI